MYSREMLCSAEYTYCQRPLSLLTFSQCWTFSLKRMKACKPHLVTYNYSSCNCTKKPNYQRTDFASCSACISRAELLRLLPLLHFCMIQGTAVATLSCSAQTNAANIMQKLEQVCGNPVSTSTGRVLRPKVMDVNSCIVTVSNCAYA